MLFKKQAVHDAWAATERTLDFKVTVKGKNYTATDISSLSYDSGAMNGEALTLGSTYTNTIKITFSHLIEGLALLDEITPQIGIQLPDGTWDFTSLGVFIIDAEVQQDRNNNTTTLSASDRMCMMGGTYESKLSYPAAINDVAVEIANMAGMKVNVDDFARLPTEKILSLGKVTYRDAIGYVAQFAGGFATFDRDGLLDIRVLSDPDFTVTPDQYQSKGLTKNEAFYRIGGLTCSVTTTVKDDSGSETQETTTLQAGSTAGTQIILNNPGMTQTLLDGLYEQLQDLNFYPFSLSWFGDPSLEAGDWITVQDTAGNEFKTPNLLYSLTFGGGVTATSKADTTITASANFVYRGATNQIITNIRRYLNAAGHAISEGIDEPTSPKAGDIWFKKEGPDTTIMTYVIDPETGVGSWHEGPSTKANAELQKLFEDLKEEMKGTSAAASAAVIAGSAAMVAGNQASAAGSAAQSAADSVAAKVVESSKEVAAAKSAAASAVDQASQAVAAAFDNNQQISTLKTDMADATTQASAAYASANTALSTANTALDNAKTAIDSATTAATDASTALSTANTALTNANQAVTTTKTLSTKVDDITNTITTLATTETVNKLTGTVTTVQTLAQQNAAGLLTKADTKIVDTLNKTVSDHSAQLKLTATGAQFDAVSKVVDGVKNTVTTNTANIAANTQALMLAAKQTTVDALSKTVDNQTAQLKLTATEAELKTAQTSINTLDGRVTSINGQLNVQAGLIAAKVTASDVTGMLNGYATQSWSQGQISAAKNEISASVETVKQNVNSLQVNSRNLARGTQNWNGDTFYYESVKVLNEVFMGTQIATDSVGAWQDVRYAIADLVNRGLVIGNQDYTLSVWCRLKLIDETTTDYAKAEVMFFGENTSMNGTTMINDLDTSWRRVSITFRFTGSPQTGHLRFERPSADGLTYFQQAGFTLNLGNKDLGWQPAPEDQATVDWTKSQLDITDKKITAGITTVTNTLNNNIASATANMATTTWTNTQIDAAKTAINLSVEQSITTSENTLNNNIANATNDMATKTWTKGQLDLTDSSLTSQISSVKDGLTTQYTQLQQTLNGVQATANNAVTQGQLTLLSDQFTSTISGISVGGTNLYLDTKSFANPSVWSNFSSWSSTAESFNGFKVLESTGLWSGLSQTINVKKSEHYTFSLYAKRADSAGGSTHIYWTDNNSTVNLSSTMQSFKLTDDWQRISMTVTISRDGYIRPRIERDTDDGYQILIAGLKLDSGNLLTAWSPAPEDQATVADVSSQFTQLQNDINLRVKTGDLINQINISTEGILIDGQKVHITGATKIDSGIITTAEIKDAAITSAKIGALAVTTANIGYAAVTNAEIAALAVGTAQIADGAISNAKIGNLAVTAAKIANATINDAKIASVSASKLTAGTIDAANINVIHLNANNITTGTISGANLSINLSTGEILFQKGAIKSTSGNLDIEIDDGTMTVTNSAGNGSRFANGNIYMTSKDWSLWGGKDPDYGSFEYSDGLAGWIGKKGVKISGAEGAQLGTKDFSGMSSMLQPTGAGISTSATVAFMGAEEMIELVAGPSIGLRAPSITIGPRSRIELIGDYVDIPSAYDKTASGSANLIVASDGALVRSTSASKYKTDIQRTMNDEYGQKLLDLPTATWLDKADMKRYSDDPAKQPVPTRNFGMIAEDLAAAGLEYLVVRGQDGQLEGIEYDRIGPALIPVIAKLQKRIEILEQLKGEI
ncbi:hypothetical protein [Loigolactobacillus zhaoyuanensis]|uniref:hypothetical protein n=1 Tax=Loigolactobacillus zhaoyuanensis TaxID=2486017 RepID=UPI000F74BABA|nr:hypothetical protein [Loigolactobacillus zhaoyuanensis]